LQLKADKNAEVARNYFQLGSDGWGKKAAEHGLPLINFTALVLGTAVFLKVIPAAVPAPVAAAAVAAPWQRWRC
jgi:hypothetical protein